MSSLLRCIARNDRGTALIEYSSLILLISIAAIAALTETGRPVNNGFGNASNG